MSEDKNDVFFSDSGYMSNHTTTTQQTPSSYIAESTANTENQQSPSSQAIESSGFFSMLKGESKGKNSNEGGNVSNKGVKSMKNKLGNLDFFKKMTLIMVFLTAVVVFLYIVSVTTAMSKKGANVTQTVQKESYVNVSVKEVVPEYFSEMISLNADLKSLNGSISIMAPISGTYIKNNVKLGDSVKKGDVLGIVDATDIGLSYNSAPVVAKADGVITDIPCYVNQKVSVSNILYTIEPEPDFVLKASVSESDVDSIKLGSVGYFVTAGDKNTNHTAHLSYISPSVNPTTRTIAIELTVDKDEKNLKGLRNGNFVELKLVKSEINDAFVVPKDAIRAYGGKEVVYLVGSENTAQRVEVVTGSRNQSQVVITNGLNRGDKVIVQGSPQDGDKVKVL